MDIVRGALSIVRMSFDLPMTLWPVTLVLLALACWAGYKLVLAQRYRSRATLTLLFSSVVVFLTIPFYAAVFWANHDVHTPETQELPTDVLGIAVWGYIAVVALAIILAKGYRLPLAGVAAFAVWMNCGIIFVATMAVSGVWL
jgi:hypothetical protein